MLPNNLLKKIGIFLVPLLILVAIFYYHDNSSIKQYQKNPALAQTDAETCIKALQQKENIKSDDKCRAVMAYGKSICTSRQKEGALLFKNYDCSNDAQMLWMVYQGIN